MRTTLAIDDDVLEEVKQYAAQRDISLGKAATDLIRRGISRPLSLKCIDGIYVPVSTCEHSRPDDQTPARS